MIIFLQKVPACFHFFTDLFEHFTLPEAAAASQLQRSRAPDAPASHHKSPLHLYMISATHQTAPLALLLYLFTNFTSQHHKFQFTENHTLHQFRKLASRSGGGSSQIPTNIETFF